MLASFNLNALGYVKHSFCSLRFYQAVRLLQLAELFDVRRRTHLPSKPRPSCN